MTLFVVSLCLRWRWRKIYNMVWQVLLCPTLNKKQRKWHFAVMWNICFYLMTGYDTTRFSRAALTESRETIFRWSSDLTQHFNTSCTLCSAGKRQSKARGTRMTVDHTVWVQTCLSFFVFPLPFAELKTHALTHTHTRSHMCKPHRGKSGKIHAVIENKWHQQHCRWLQSKIQTTSGLA